MDKAIVLAVIMAAVSADPKSKPTVITPLAVAPESPSGILPPRGYQVVPQRYNDLVAWAPILANTPSVASAPLVSKLAPVVEASLIPDSTQVLSAPILAKPAPVAAKSFPIIAAKAAPIVAAPALAKAPFVAAPLVVKSAALASSPEASRAALLAGPGVPSAYNSLASPYVYYPYVSSPYISGANYV